MQHMMRILFCLSIFFRLLSTDAFHHPHPFITLLMSIYIHSDSMAQKKEKKSPCMCADILFVNWWDECERWFTTNRDQTPCAYDGMDWITCPLVQFFFFAPLWMCIRALIEGSGKFFRHFEMADLAGPFVIFNLEFWIFRGNFED